MKIIEIFESLNIGVGGWSVVLLLLMSLVQIAPIKFNPLSWIVSTFGRALNKDLYDKVGDLEKAINGVAEEQIKERAAREEDKAVLARIRILRFNDELLSQHKHSKESFDQALDDITYYRTFCDDHRHFENDKAVMAINNIKRNYEKCCEENSFL